ncbi:MAG: DNA-processing protein DprA [Alphaproteobacteria bacterium]|nr:DNA-processing protein DprA [Alphaproteobacteria bacterium]
MANQQELMARLRLFRSTNIGAVGFHQFINHYGSAINVLENLPKLYRGKKIELISEQKITEEWQNLQKLGGKFIFHGDACYPASMAHLPDAPPILSLLGNENLLANDMIAMVGARNASVSGCKIAMQLAHDLTQAGYNVVTGFARGIDIAAHQAALQQARAIGVLAGGVNHIYPPQHHEFYQQTLKYGALVSERPLDYHANASAFPRRNRIIAGMAKAVVVVEAAQKSGSLITAQYGEKYGRTICALPGSPLDGRAQGANQLIKKGAFLVENADDIIAAINQQNHVQEQETFDFSSEMMPLDFDDDALENACDAIMNALSPTPSTIDDLIVHLQISPAIINAALLMLELEGKVHRFPGNKFSTV